MANEGMVAPLLAIRRSVASASLPAPSFHPISSTIQTLSDTPELSDMHTIKIVTSMAWREFRMNM
jgi:hypothetical protein